MERDKRFDILKGILIILVVIGHSGAEIIGSIIFLFHMPLFFMVSGYFIKEDDQPNKDLIIKKLKRLIFPYIFYMFIDFFVFKIVLSFRNVSVSYIVRRIICFLWGGRLQPGVYWYVTVLFFSIILFAYLRKKFESRKVLLYAILIGGEF